MIPPAERARHARRRKALGVRVHQIELDNFQLQQLVDAGLIEPEAIDDQYRLAESLGFALEELLARYGVTDNN